MARQDVAPSFLSHRVSVASGFHVRVEPAERKTKRMMDSELELDDSVHNIFRMRSVSRALPV